MTQTNVPKFATPPEGWETFGTNVDAPSGTRIEFSEKLDENGLPLWERIIT